MNKRLAIALAVAFLVGCGDPNKLTAGEVSDVDYDDEDHVETISCAAYDKNMSCTLWLPHTVVEPAVYKLKIVGVYKDETVEEWHKVSQWEYTSCQVHDHYEAGKGCQAG